MAVNNTQKRYKAFILLHFAFLLFSLGGIMAKTAAGYPFMSIPFIAFYTGFLFILFLYALMWQQLLKKMPLTVAFSNKAVVVLWGMLWGRLFFNEEIRLNMLIGALIVLFGILIVVNADE